MVDQWLQAMRHQQQLRSFRRLVENFRPTVSDRNVGFPFALGSRGFQPPAVADGFDVFPQIKVSQTCISQASLAVSLQNSQDPFQSNFGYEVQIH